MMQATQRCADCGTEAYTPAPGGFCPTCLLQLGFEAQRPATALESTDLAPLLAIRHEPEAVRFHRFDDYELLEEMGRGGMGVVFRARQVSLNRPVALKLILTGRLASPALVKRFQLEAAAAAGLRHPHIVAIYEVGERDGQHFYSMELMEGAAHDLAALRLTRPSQGGGADPVPAREQQQRIATVMSSVARAVEFAHQHGVLHRDLKPSNILLDRQGQPRLADFGLARILDGEGTRLTLSGAVMGTPGYMAPEQVYGQGTAVTAAADIYSLGAILYFLLTGRSPFEGESPVNICRRVLDSEPAQPRALNARVDPDLATIALKCLEKEPVRRYPSAQALADDLERWLLGVPITARKPTTLFRTVRWLRRHPAATVALVVSVGLVTLLPLALLRLAEAREEKRQFVSSVRDEKVRELQALRKDWAKLEVPFVAISSELRTEIWKARTDISVPEFRRGRYTFGIYAHEKPVETAGQFAPFLAWMEGQLSSARSNRVRIDLRVYKDNRTARQALVRGAVDVVRLGAGPFLAALEEMRAGGEKVEVLAKARPGRYEATLFARAGTDIFCLADLPQRSLALGDPESTISGLHVPALLGAAGFTTNEIRTSFHRSHTESISAVLNGRFDAGVAKTPLFERERRRKPGLVAITNVTCLSMPWVARSGLGPDVVKLLRRQLLSLHAADILDLLPDKPIEGFEAATAEEYDNLREQQKSAERFFDPGNSSNSRDDQAKATREGETP